MRKTNLIDDRLLYLFAVKSEETGDACSPYFGKWPCHCCGDMKGGDRYDAEAVIREISTRELVIKDIVSVCPDCLEYWQ